MELIVIGIAAFGIAALTLLSGFGLGTVLTPLFALFFPVPVAVAATAVVHFANNLFKLGLLAKMADWKVVARFGIPAALAAAIGASLLTAFDRLPALGTYSLGGSDRTITWVKLVIGLLIAIFAVLEFLPSFQKMALPARWLPVGGVLSGFFGGLSGNQGALRSAFLIKAGLSKEAFVATGAVAAVIVDAVRLAVYGGGVLADHLSESQRVLAPVAVGTLCAFAGSYAGRHLLKKVTIRTVQLVVAAGMLIVGILLAAGII